MPAPESRSVFAEVLERFQFEEWPEECVCDELDEEEMAGFEAYGPLSFVFFDYGDWTWTLALDDLKHWWLTDGFIDLTRYGFTQILFDDVDRLVLPVHM